MENIGPGIQNYIDILEKTNQQLNPWYNPYGLMIGILTLLVALIAMGVAYALWRHSKEQRDRMNQFYTEQEKMINEKNKQVQKVEEKLNDLIKEYEKQLKDSTKQGKKEIQRAIEELKKEKAKIGAYIGPLTVSGGISTMSSSLSSDNIGLYGLNRNTSMICTQCGKIFYYKDSDNSIIGGDSILYGAYGTSFKDKDVYCTHCGARNIPQ